MPAMNPVVQHLVLLLFAGSFSLIGSFMVRNPAKVFRFFTFGLQSEQRFFVGFVKATGWCFAILFAAGAVLNAVLVTIAPPWFPGAICIRRLLHVRH